MYCMLAAGTTVMGLGGREAPWRTHLSLSYALWAVASGDGEKCQTLHSPFVTLSDAEEPHIMADVSCCLLRSSPGCRKMTSFHHFTAGTAGWPLSNVVWRKTHANAINWPIRPQMWFGTEVFTQRRAFTQTLQAAVHLHSVAATPKLC